MTLDEFASAPVVTHSERETMELGTQMASNLEPGMVVGLYGQLGAGKTQLVKGICAGLGYPAQRVHSPTFTIVNQYETPSITVFHFDAYRIERLEEFYDLGYEDYFFGDALCLVEWADRVEQLMPANTLRVHLEHEREGARCIRIVGLGG